jgi:radical SAM superfamily enzyme YgiQ (UPF0313 family)
MDFQASAVETLERYFGQNAFDIIVAGYSPNFEHDDLQQLERICTILPAAVVILLANHLDRIDIRHAEGVLERNPHIAALVTDYAFNGLVCYLAGKRDGSVFNVLFRDDGRLVHTAVPLPETVEIPVPRHELFVSAAYCHYDSMVGLVTATMSSFGCNRACRFCWGPQLYPRISNRSVENVVIELEHIVRCGISEVYFNDLLFANDAGHALALCRRIVEKKIRLRWFCSSRFDLMTPELILAMAEAGCGCIEFGLESGNSQVRRLYGKDVSDETVREVVSTCHARGIHTAVFVILGLPEETLADMERSLAFVRKLKPDYLSLNVLWADPIAEIGASVKLDSSVAGGCYSSEINFTHPHVTQAEIRRLYRKAVRQFYFQGYSLARQLLRMRSWRRMHTVAGIISGLFRRRAV